MKIAILGAGNAGCAVATDLTLKGHEVTLIKTSNSMHNDNFQFLLDHDGQMSLSENGEVRTAHISKVTKDFSAISDVEVVIIYIQTVHHEELIKRIKDYLRDGQIVIINPGYFSTAYMLKHCSDKDLTIVEDRKRVV